MPDEALPRKLSLETTARLVELIRQGDKRAREVLPARYLVPLQQYAHRKLPAWARSASLNETNELVNNALLRALDKIEKGQFIPERQGSFLAYVRRAVMRGVIDEVRKAKKQPPITDLDFDHIDPTPNAVRMMIVNEELERFYKALHELPEKHQDAVMMHVQMDSTYPEIALAVGYPSPAAARMAVTRALAAIVARMSRDSRDGEKP